MDLIQGLLFAAIAISVLTWLFFRKKSEDFIKKSDEEKVEKNASAKVSI